MSKCVTAYCLNVPNEPGTVVWIGITATGFQTCRGADCADPVTTPGFEDAEVISVPLLGTVAIQNLTSEAHTLTIGTYTIPVAADEIIADAGIDTSAPAILAIACTDHLSEGVPIKQSRLRIYYPGALDINQVDRIASSGCCRASVVVELKMHYRGFEDADGSPYPHYLKRRVSTKYYAWDTSANTADIITNWRGAEFSGTVPEVTRRITYRVRSPKTGREGRPEYMYLDANGDPGGDHVDFHAFAGVLVGGREEIQFENGEAIHNWTRGTPVPGNWTQESPTKKTRPIFQDRFYDGDYLDTAQIGIETDEVMDVYEWADFRGYMFQLMESENDDVFEDVTFPMTAMRRQWLFGDDAEGPDVLVGGVRCTPADDTGEGSVPDHVFYYDDEHGQGYQEWPLPNLFPPYCIFDEACGGFGPSGIPWQYGCEQNDIRNSDNGFYPPDYVPPRPDVEIIEALSGELWKSGQPTSPFYNHCASAQAQQDVVSPPVHYMAGMTYDTTFGGILVTRRIVRRWYNAAMCRRIYEEKDPLVGPVLVHCEHIAGGFAGANRIPSTALFDNSGNYTVPGLVPLVTYQFDRVAGETLVAQGNTYTVGHFTFDGTPVIIQGVPNGPVQSAVRGNNNVAPCSTLDDPADRNELGAGVPVEDYELLRDWHLQIHAGDYWVRFTEIDCPDHSQSPPCGCA